MCLPQPPRGYVMGVCCADQKEAAEEEVVEVVGILAFGP